MGAGSRGGRPAPDVTLAARHGPAGVTSWAAGRARALARLQPRGGGAGVSTRGVPHPARGVPHPAVRGHAGSAHTRGHAHPHTSPRVCTRLRTRVAPVPPSSPPTAIGGPQGCGGVGWFGGCVRGRAPHTRLAARVSARVYASLVLARRFCDLGSCIGKLHRYRHRTAVCAHGDRYLSAFGM